MPRRHSHDLLVEIGTEELPPKALRGLARSFADGLGRALSAVQLVPGSPRCKWYASPRRLGAVVADVRTRQPDQARERRGPAVNAAFDDAGQPTRAAVGFARSCGVDVDQLERAASEKGEWLVFRSRHEGVPARDLIPDCIEQSVKQLPIPKRMRWGDVDAEFVRPVHWLVILHGQAAIKARLLGVASGPFTRGHRFHCPQPLELTDAGDYEQTLLDPGSVIADFDERKAQIARQIKALARRRQGKAVVDDALLDEVTGLVEWPHALLGDFDPQFLDIPPEVLVSSMRDHQKYFHLHDAEDRLLPCFITVANIESTSPQRIRQGNERVLNARLSDARFFWDADRKVTLERHADGLVNLLFHKRLGSVADKVERMRRLVDGVTPRCGADTPRCLRAAQLCKADLVSDMVGEFPELQGVMGRYLAQHDGEHPQVSRAIEDHYKPRFAGDELPHGPVGKAIALVDRIDSLVGLFAVGEEPSGDKDPYALRRAALGVLRITIEGEIDIDLPALLEDAARFYGELAPVGVVVDEETLNRVYDFIVERLRAYYLDRGFSSDEIASVVATRPNSPADFDRRLRAVSRFRALEAAENLAAANKRIGNILKKSGVAADQPFSSELIEEEAERGLADVLEGLGRSVRQCFESGRYEQGLAELSVLKEPVDRFFDEVMVMVDDPSLRDNRLALLRDLQALFLMVADISQLQAPGHGTGPPPAARDAAVP